MKKKPSRLAQALLETAGGCTALEFWTTMLSTRSPFVISERLPSHCKSITPEEIRALRERANLSQAAFARYLNLTSVMSRNWSAARSGPKPALALLNVIRTKGIEVVL